MSAAGALIRRRVATNGVELEVAEQGSGPLVVLLHGFPEGAYGYRHQLPALAAAGFRAVAPDQRGYGQSDAPHEIEAYDQVTLAADVAGLIQALGEEQAVLVGHDWGSVVAGHTALLYPQRVRGLVEMSIPFTGRAPASPLAMMRAAFKDRFFYIVYFQTPGPAEAELEADVTRSLRMIFHSVSGDAPEGDGGARAFTAQPMAFSSSAGLLETLSEPQRLPDWLSEADLQTHAAAFARRGFRGALNWYRNFDRTWERTAALAGVPIRQPALFIAGERDPVLTWNRGQLDQMRRLMPGLKETIILPDCGHWVQQERPRELNEILLRFLRGLS